MNQPRTPLRQISGNSTQRKQLKPNERGEIIGALKMGHTPVQVAKGLKRPRGTVRSTLQRHSQRKNEETIPRGGRPREYTDRDVRRLVQHIRKFPMETWQQVKDALHYPWHKNTLRKMLEPSGITNWRARSRPELTEVHARLRLTWAVARKDWTLAQWRQYMWSDECSAERGKGGAVAWVFRTAGADAYAREYVQTYAKSKDISAMVWGCFWIKNGQVHRSDLYILDRDFESKKHGYSSRSYLEVLEDQMPKCWEPGLIFMQDGASIHTSRAVRQWFQDMGIPVADHPAVSPDLNPIEHIWWHLKAWVLKHHPELNNMGKSNEAQQALEEALIEAWEALPDSLFLACADSMPDRVKAVIQANGWHTKY